MKKLLCTECAALHNPADFCPVHPDEPLLDPDDDDVRFELMRLDDRRRARAFAVWIIALGATGFALGITAYILLLSVAPLTAESLRMPMISGGAFLGGFIGGLIAAKRYTPKFKQWTKDA